MNRYSDYARIDGGPGRRADRPLRLDGTRKLVIENARNRLMVPAVLFALCFLVLGWKVIGLGLEGSGVPKVAEAKAATAVSVAVAPRRLIVDRNGVPMAGNLPEVSLYAHPANVDDPQATARQLATVLPDLDVARTTRALASDASFVWIRRKLIPRRQWAVNRLGNPALEFRTRMQRVYPQGPLAAHLLGYVNIDNQGAAGVERYFDDELSGPARPAGPLRLSLDVRVQHALRDELAREISDQAALGGAGLVMDADSGEILAMVSLPDFDPNHLPRPTDPAMFNRATRGVYEMGSTFKTFTVAQALDRGIARLGDKYDATKPLHEAGWTIRDDHPKARWLTVPEIYIYSSNIGAARLALDIGLAPQRDFLRQLGLLSPPEIELPEVGRPILPDPWVEISSLTLAYGHGLSVSPLQLVSAIAAMVNGGILRRATLIRVKDGQTVPGRRVIAADTSDTIRALMRLVVVRGTGHFADAPGYLVGGKTGTAEKVTGGHYSRKALLSSFVGIFPSNKVRYLVFAMLDEPKGNAATQGLAAGGWVAAPVVSRVVTRIAPLLGVRPQSPEAAPATGATLASMAGITLP